jgi:DNA invertase Pin-like site-specific DNA recombinase
VNGQSKITRSHRDRIALIYVRQSTLAQVRDNSESTARQYALGPTATQLGWPAKNVTVIDSDLGLSASSSGRRSGFREVIARMCLGEIGAIFGLEVSRLARSSADFQRLLELARLTDTLLVDAEGVYDLSDFNDRLVLGLKGTMSEIEIHLLKARMDGAKRAAAQRGDLRLRLPIGYIYDDENTIVMDPDAEVVAAVSDVFATFQATGSAYAVVSAFADRKFPYRVHGGPFDGQLRWGPLSHNRVLSILANPVYAGAYTYGRRPSTPRVDADGVIRTATVHRQRADWPVLITDHHPTYLSWQEYLDNEDRRAANHTSRKARPVREGFALCQGIISCGSCGSPMRTHYHQRAGHRASYFCSASREGHQPRTTTCRSVPAETVDHAVADLLLDTLTPTQVVLTLAAADEVITRAARTIRAGELAVQRAHYDADRAERAFDACEPENRLVARTLEARWEAKLAVLADAEATLTAIHAALPAVPNRGDLQTLLGDVHTLWHAPTTTDRDRKRLLRTLIADVTILPEPNTTVVGIGMRWHTGATDEITCPTTRPRPPSAAIDLIRQHATALTDQALADLLNAGGHTTTNGKPFGVHSVRWTRHRHQIPSWGTPQPGEITASQAATILGIKPCAIYRWINHDRLPARHTTAGRWSIPWDPTIEATCRNMITASTQLRTTTSHSSKGGAV